ncbi:MAG: ABC transporter ATP-binding protein, partial [Micrococcales bacterium]|nr:ABC transporter ATP-binding protein [Micrococcales bacterium]
ELLLLDEPTSGLDPLMETVFRDQIDAFRCEGHAVLLSSHVLEEVERLCDRVTIIRSGRCVESGTLAELRHLTRTSVSADLATPPVGLDTLEGVHNVEVDSATVHLEVDTTALGALLDVFQVAGVLSLTCQPPTLEDLFLRHYGDRLDTRTRP